MEALFLKIINMGITAGWIALAVMVVRWLLKKAPKWITVLMWGLVAIRLVCPISWESGLSLIPSVETVPGDIMYMDAPAIHSGVRVVNSVVNPVLSESLAPAAGASVNPMQVLTTLASVVWALGLGAMLVYTAVSYWNLHRKVREAVPLRENLWLCDRVDTPFILGVIRPRIFLPSAMDEGDLEYVIAHEKAHLKRRDHWWKPIGFLLLAVYWFQPLLWIGYILLCRDIELACDEKVIRDMELEHKMSYSNALINCSVPRRMVTACPLAFGEVGVKERVKSVMHYKKPAFWIVLGAAAACTAVAVCFLTNPVEFRFDGQKILSASWLDLRQWEAAGELSPAELEELSDRLAGVRGAKRDGRYEGQTPRYQICATLEDGSQIEISGYAQSGTEMVDIAWREERYVVSDGDFQGYLSRICAREDVTEPVQAPAATKWFDYLEDPDQMPWEGGLEIQVPAFPNVTFRWHYAKMEAVTEGESKPLYAGMPIWSAYFCDLTGDGLPELCSTLSYGSGMIDNRIVIYDYANGASYGLEDRGTYDYTLRLDAGDGQLYVDQRVYNSDEVVSSGRLTFQDGYIHMKPISANTGERIFQVQQLMEKYPCYFALDASKGLDVYVSQFAENADSFVLRPHSETLLDWTSSELLNLPGTDAEEMRLILSTYDLDEADVQIIPWQHPLSSYIGAYWAAKGADGEAAAYVERIRQLLFGEQPDSMIYDSMVFDVDGDGEAESCVLAYGRTSGLFTFRFYAKEIAGGQMKYDNVFWTDWYDLSFVECDDGVVRVQGIDQEEVPQTHLFNIGVVDGNLCLTEGDQVLYGTAQAVPG